MKQKNKQPLEDFLDDIRKELKPTNWTRIFLCLFFGSLFVQAIMFQFDEIKPGVKVVSGLIVLSCGFIFGALYRLNHKPQEKQKTFIYPWTHPGSKDVQHGGSCPVCGTMNIIKAKSGVVKIPKVCNPRCDVKIPHLHASCNTCLSNFLSAPSYMKFDPTSPFYEKETK